MNSISIVAAAVAAVFVLVIVGRLLHRPNTVSGSDHDVAMPGGAVGSFVLAVNRCETEDDPQYLAAVEALRSDKSAGAAIEQAYTNAAPELKHSLLLAAAHAGPTAHAFLTSVASSPISRGGRTAEMVEDSRLRLVALDGLEWLALAGRREAWDDIEQLASSQDRAVRVGAVAALKFGGIDDALARLRKKLPLEEHYLFDVQRPDVRDVPQISDPTRDLPRFDIGSSERPHPERPVMSTSASPRQRKGSPRIGGRSNG